MKSKFKPIVLLMCLVVVLNALAIGALGASKATVSAEEVFAGEGNLLVPINITSSAKLMGFKLSLSFDSRQVKVKGVSRGSVTSKGTFNTNFGVYDGKFDVIWNNTSQVDANGTLFVLTLDTSKTTKDNEIKITFSQPDTFDEAYKDVALECKPIKISSKAELTQQETTTQKAENTTTEPETIIIEDEVVVIETQNPPSEPHYDNSQMADSVNNALDNIDADKIYDVPAEDKQDFIASVNGNINTMLGTQHDYYANFNDLLNAYEKHYTDSFTNGVMLGADASQIKDTIDDALKQVGANSINDVKDKLLFIQAVEKNTQKLNPDVPAMSEHISEEEAFKTITKIYNTSQNTIDAFLEAPTQPQAEENTRTLDNNVIIFIVIGIVLVIAVVLIVIVVIKKRKDKRK